MPQIVGDGFKLLSLTCSFTTFWPSIARGCSPQWKLLQAGLILVAYWMLVQHLGDRAAVVSYALATFVVGAATLVLVVRTPGLSRRSSWTTVSALIRV